MSRPRLLALQRSPLGPLWALLLMLTPAWIAVASALYLSGEIDLWFRDWSEPLVELLRSWPQPFAEIFAGDYGFITMGPLLLVWATPVVVIHSLLMSMYKVSGFLNHLTTAMSPWLRPFGITGQELARVVMGFGCNVPAVIGTKSSPACYRGSCVSAITFGSACSYQLGATLAVFAVAGRPELVITYLLYLAATTLAFVRLITRPSGRYPLNVLTSNQLDLLTWPHPREVWQEAQSVIIEFLKRALPIFLLMTAAVSILQWLGALQAASVVIEPTMAIFRLPSEVAPAIVFSSVRKDGILLLAEPSIATSLSAIQLLTAVYLAGVLLPCLITCLTVMREHSRQFAFQLMGQQAVAAIGFSCLLAWSGAWLWP